MEITVEKVERTTIEKFAQSHNLKMKITERNYNLRKQGLSRWYASFKDCDVKGDGVLIGIFGNGETQEEAIKDYAKKINLQTLVVQKKGLEKKLKYVKFLMKTKRNNKCLF